MWDKADGSPTCQVAPGSSELQRENNVLRQENTRLKQRAEREQRPSDERFSVMANPAQDAIMMMDAKGHITFYNKTAESMFGWTADEAMGKDLHTLMVPQRFHQAYREGLAHFQHTGQGPAIGKTLELTTLRKDGTEFPVEISLAAVMLNDEWHAMGIVRDITERKRAEEVLPESEKQLQDILNSIVAGVLIIDPQTHTIIDVNESGAAMVGMSRDDIIGKTCHEFVCPAERGQCPVTELGQSMDESERVLVRADGSTLPIVKSVKEGTFRGRSCLVESLVPIAEHKKAENELKESLSLLEATLESTADGILVVNHEGHIRSCNTQFKKLWRIPEDIIQSGDDRKVMSFVLGQLKDPDQFVSKVRELYSQPAEESVDMIDFADGRVFERYSKPHVVGDQITGRVWSFRDVTEQHRAQQGQEALMRQVAAANEELTHFAYVVSHDLKAPLRGIKLLTEWLCSDYADKLGDDAKEQLDLLQNRVGRMHNLIEGVLQYSRVGRIKEDMLSIDLNALLSSVVDAIAPPEHISVTVQGSLPTIKGEKTRIMQIFQNLLTNAVKYMDKPQGHVTVACVDEENAWRFGISDNGPGIETKHFERIFRIFQTLAPKDEFESTGVGLTLVKKIVELYGGNVWVESVLGEGSTFFFTLPKQDSTAQDERSADADLQDNTDHERTEL